MHCLFVKGEPEWRSVPVLTLKRQEIHRASVDAGRSTGLEPSELKAQIIKLQRQFSGGCLSGPAGWHLRVQSHVYSATQKCARCEHYGRGIEGPTIQHTDTFNTVSRHQDSSYRSLSEREAVLP